MCIRDSPRSPRPRHPHPSRPRTRNRPDDRMARGNGEPTATGNMTGMDHGSMEMDGLDQAEAMTELGQTTGTDFDRRFLELMIAHHTGALDMAQTQLADGTN